MNKLNNKDNKNRNLSLPSITHLLEQPSNDFNNSSNVNNISICDNINNISSVHNNSSNNLIQFNSSFNNQINDLNFANLKQSSSSSLTYTINNDIVNLYNKNTIINQPRQPSSNVLLKNQFNQNEEEDDKEDINGINLIYNDSLYTNNPISAVLVHPHNKIQMIEYEQNFDLEKQDEMIKESHKLAERQRRKQMKQLFENLRQVLPANKLNKASKWEILSQAINYINSLKCKNDQMYNELQRLKSTSFS
ncbi:hypothetical protein K502DRAFT_326471 [Neoconidiobolus thromboides FSU 785]|nr:hypothetical protein K502DRAFT_326471 [Neoconidiobolus thromboides FSU 785]